jgi:hypothetical protein
MGHKLPPLTMHKYNPLYVHHQGFSMSLSLLIRLKVVQGRIELIQANPLSSHNVPEFLGDTIPAQLRC